MAARPETKTEITAIFLTLPIFLSARISPAFAKVVFPKKIGGLLYEANPSSKKQDKGSLHPLPSYFPEIFLMNP